MYWIMQWEKYYQWNVKMNCEGQWLFFPNH